jgi:hypothetical protein
MESYSAGRAEVDAAWDRIDGRLAELPPALARLGRGFLSSLAGAGGSSRDYFSNQWATPLVHLPLWMREALRRQGRWPRTLEADEAVRSILTATMWGYFYIRIQDDLIDERGLSPLAGAHALLGNICVHEMHRLYGPIAAGTPAFAAAFERAWIEFTECTLREREQLLLDEPYSAEQFEAHAAKVAFARVPLLAVCALAGVMEEREAAVRVLVHRLGIAYGFLNDIRGWERDAANGHRTYLLARAGWLHGAEDPATLESRLHEGQVLYGSFSEARAWYDRAAEAARELGLGEEFELFTQERSRWIDERQTQLFSVALALALKRAHR